MPASSVSNRPDCRQKQHRHVHVTWTTYSHSHVHPYLFVHPRSAAQWNNSPSPCSTDEDLPSPPVSVRTPCSYMTSTTSPFLSGLSTLNIHTAHPSHASSPTMLPLLATWLGSPRDNFYWQRGGGVLDSPLSSFIVSHKQRSSTNGKLYRYESNTASCLKLMFFSVLLHFNMPFPIIRVYHCMDTGPIHSPICTPICPPLTISRHLSSPVGLAAMVVHPAATHIHKHRLHDHLQHIHTPPTIHNHIMPAHTCTHTLLTRL